MRRLREAIARLAPRACTVLIRGETGTGKELVARALHDGSGRVGEPFVAVNCGALNSLADADLFGSIRGAYTDAKESRIGFLEEAGRGTIFLDEIGDMPAALQTRLLRVLEQRVFRACGSSKDLAMRARVVAATNADLERRIAGGQFREDLFYRLQVATIFTASIREMTEDFDLLARSFAATSEDPFELTDDGLEALRAREWPGNVRQLRNAIAAIGAGISTRLADRHAVIGALDDGAQAIAVKADALDELVAMAPLGAPVLSWVSEQIARRALKQAGGSKTVAARRLGMSRDALRRLLQARTRDD